MAEKKIDYEAVFNHEIDAWCYGLAQYPGEVHRPLVHKVIREFNIIFVFALRHGVVFDLLDVAEKVARSCKYLIPEKELVFTILAQLPPPNWLKEEQEMYTLAAILDKVDQVYNGAVERYEKRHAANY